MFGLIAQGVMMIAGAVKKRDQDKENTANAQQSDAENAHDVWEDNTAVNKSIAETNLQNAIRTGYRVGIANVQRAQSRKEAASAGLALSKQKLDALSSAEANSAGAGSIGASVDAVASDIEIQAGRATEGLIEDQRIREMNMDNELISILQAGEDAIVAPQSVSVRRANRPRVLSAAQNALPGLLQLGMQYMSDRMSLGLGTKPAAVGDYGGMGQLH